MKHSQLKQLIREELKKALSRNEYEMGETILWKGSRVEVVEDEDEFIEAWTTRSAECCPDCLEEDEDANPESVICPGCSQTWCECE